MTRQLRWPLASLALLALALALWELASRRLGLPALVLPPRRPACTRALYMALRCMPPRHARAPL